MLPLLIASQIEHIPSKPALVSSYQINVENVSCYPEDDFTPFLLQPDVSILLPLDEHHICQPLSSNTGVARGLEIFY